MSTKLLLSNEKIFKHNWLHIIFGTSHNLYDVNAKNFIMKFDKVKPKERWCTQKVYHRLSFVKKDIADFNREMNAIEGQKRDLQNRKEIIKNKIANKWRYFRQLQAQLKETHESDIL